MNKINRIKRLVSVGYLLLITIFSFGQIQVNTNFEGGNGILLNADANNYVQVESEFKLGDTRNIVFYCQITGLDASIPLQFDLEAESVSDYIFYSYDNLTWERSITTNAGVHTIPLTSDEIYVAHFPPYLNSRINSYLDSLNILNLAHTQISNLAISEGGLAVQKVRITDPCIEDLDKKIIWLLGRQHAKEDPANYATEGMLRFFVSDDEQAQRLRKEAIINIVPLMDVDMVFVGGTGKEQAPVDFNRDWIAPTHDSHWSAVKTVKEMIDNEPNELCLFLDMHSFGPGQPANKHYAIDDPSQKLFAQNFIERTNLNGGLPYEILHTGVVNPAISKDYIYLFYPNPNLLSLTPETAFDLAPDGTFWTVPKLLDQGLAFGKACSDYINGLDKPLEQVVENDSPNIDTTGTWINSTTNPGYSGTNYQFAGIDSDATFTFRISPASSGLFGVSTHYSSDVSRASNVSYQLLYNGEVRDYTIDQTILGTRWRHLDTITIQAGVEISLRLNAFNANGIVCADAFRIYPIESCISTSTEDPITSTPHLFCFPNPATDVINISVKGQLEYQVKLYNLEGKLILSESNSNQIKVDSIPKGIYFLEIKDSKTGKKIVEKIIIGK